MRHDTISKRLQYIRDTFAREDAALAAVGADLPEEERRMQVGPEEGKILHMLVRMIRAEKIVEIGVLNGYSAIWMARALEAGSKLYALDKNYKRYSPSRRNFENCGVADRIELLEGEALDSLKTLAPQGPFDLVFIDADKHNYCNYLDWAEANVRKGGLIIGDNTFLFGAVYGDIPREINPDTIAVMQKFNKRLADTAKYSSILLPTAEGLTVAVKEF